MNDLVGERHGCRQARRFYPVKVDQPRYAMDFWPLDDEIGDWLFGSSDLRPDPGIARLQCAAPQIGPAGTDRRVETVGTPWIDCVIDLGNPLDVRAKSRLSREIERKVHT